jgi:predicted phage terminase large subunit-like protein
LTETGEITRDKTAKVEMMQKALRHPFAVVRELNNRSLYHFLQYFWPLVSPHNFQPNWHIEFLCSELEKLAERVANRQPREYDLIINVPPGSTKSATCSHIFPAWCWTKWHWMKFITASYSSALALESADYCRDIIRSTNFQQIYPDIEIKEDKDTKSNFRIVKKQVQAKRGQSVLLGGGRYSTSVGGTLMGFHGDIIIVDDPLNPQQSVSEIELATANRWMEQTLPTRKTNKSVTPTVLIMQRLHQDDPSGHILTKQKENIRHICLPGECRTYKNKVSPPELIKFYKDDLLDPIRLSWTVLSDLEKDLGQYGYAGQIGQDPTPPGGGMFKIDRFSFISTMPPINHIIKTIRYWDKAGTQDGGAYTVGVKMNLMGNGKWLVEDVRRGRWSTEKREAIIHDTAIADGFHTVIWIEQEPGSGGKESAENTIRGLAGYSVYAEKPTGDKTFRADPYSVQVNNGNVILLTGMWNRDYVEEHRFFPFSTYKDQVDASSGAFNKLVPKRIACRIT